MRRGLSIALGAIPAFVLFSFPAAAQDRPNGFFLTSPLGLSSGYDDNFPTRTRLLDDTVTLLTTPTFAWIETTGRSRISLDYKGEFEMLAHNQNMDAWNHAANFHFRTRITPRWSIDGADSFLSTTDPTRSLTNSLLLLPRARYDENSFYTRLSYRLDHRTVFSARFDTGVTTMDLEPDLASRLNRVGASGTLTVEHMVDRHNAFSANYSYLWVHPLESGPQLANTTAQTVNGGYVYTVNSGLLLRATAGITRATQSSFTGSGAVDKRFGDFWLSAGYQRYLAFYGVLAPAGAPVGPIPFGTAVAPDSIYQVVIFRAYGNITRRWGIDGNIQRALNGVTKENRGIKSVIAQLRVDYKLSSRVTAFTRAEFYGQNVSEFTPFPMSRRRYFAGFEFALSRPPEQAEDRHRHKPLPAIADDPLSPTERVKQDEENLKQEQGKIKQDDRNKEDR